MAKCCTKKNMCPKLKTPESNLFKNTNNFFVLGLFYSDDFWKFASFLNIFIILFRLLYYEDLKLNKELFYFLLWLELQYWSFIFLLMWSYKIFMLLKKLVGYINYFLKGLFAPRIPNIIMAFLTLIRTDLFFWILWCVSLIIINVFLISFITGFYIAIVTFFGAILLGYTRF